MGKQEILDPGIMSPFFQTGEMKKTWLKIGWVLKISNEYKAVVEAMWLEHMLHVEHFMGLNPTGLLPLYIFSPMCHETEMQHD